MLSPVLKLIHVLVALVLLTACGGEVQRPTPIAKEEAISQGFLVLAPALGSTYADLAPVRYVTADSACLLLSTFLINTEGASIARIDEYRPCGAVAIDYRDYDHPVEIQSIAGLGRYCEMPAGTISGFVDGDDYQSCLTWYQDTSQFIAYTSLTDQETLDLVNTLTASAEQ